MKIYGATQWRPASGHPGGWRVVRHTNEDWREGKMLEAERRNGRPRLFRTMKAAARIADKMNEQEA